MPDFSARWNLLINSTDASTACQENEHLHSKNGAAASVAVMAEALCGNSSKINEKPVAAKRKEAPFAAVSVQRPAQAEEKSFHRGAAALCVDNLFIVQYNASELNGQ